MKITINLCTILITMLIYTSCFSQSADYGKFTGTVESGRDESGLIYNLVTKNKGSIYLCGNSLNGYLTNIADTKQVIALEGNKVTLDDGTSMFENCNFKLVDLNNNSELIGPKIFGLQIGMSYDNSKPIIDNICSKYANSLLKCEDLTGFAQAFGVSNNVVSYGNLVNTAATWIGNILELYMLPLEIFHYNKSIDANTFLEKLASSYNLSFNCNSNGLCNGNNNSIGYNVTIDLNKDFIKIERGSKTSDLEFK